MRRKSNISNQVFFAQRNFFDKNFNYAKAEMSANNYNKMLQHFNRAENGKDKKDELLVYGNSKAGATSIRNVIGYYYGPNNEKGLEGRYINYNLKHTSQRKNKISILCNSAESRDCLRTILNNINADSEKENIYQKPENSNPGGSGSPGGSGYGSPGGSGSGNSKTPDGRSGEDNKKMKKSTLVLIACAVLAGIIILRD